MFNLYIFDKTKKSLFTHNNDEHLILYINYDAFAAKWLIKENKWNESLKNIKRNTPVNNLLL